MREKNLVSSSLFFGSEKRNIFSILSNIDQKPELDKDTLATSHGLYATLSKWLGDITHVIDPALCSIDALMSHDVEERSEAAINYVKAIAGYATNGTRIENGIIHQDGGQLKKPIVMLLNTASAKPKNARDTNAIGGVHWVTCVILPKNYQIPQGLQLNNQHEKIYFVDSLYGDSVLCKEFKAALMYGVTAHTDTGNRLVTHNIVAPFPNAEFIDEVNVFQQAVGSVDCGWWALFNAIKIVETGSVDFLDPFKSAVYQNDKRQERKFACKLRFIFPELDNDENIPDKIITMKKQDPKEKLFPLKAIENSIHLFGSYQARGDAVPGRKGNDYQTLVLLYHALESYFNSENFSLKTEVDDNTNLDDLELRVGNQLKKYQIKHASKENDYYTPEDLLHVTKSKLVDDGGKLKYKKKSGSGKKGGDAPVVHFFESWHELRYGENANKHLEIEYALYTNHDFNKLCLRGLLNPETRTFHADFSNMKDEINGVVLNKAQISFRENIFDLIKNLKIVDKLTDAKKNQRIIEFFSVFKFLLRQPYIDELEKKIRDLLKKNNIDSDGIYYSLYYKYNLWLRTRLEESRALAVTQDTTKELLIELQVKCQFLPRLIGRSQYYLEKTVQTTIKDHEIYRQELHTQCNHAMSDKKPVIFVQGEKGVGKSAFVKKFIQEKGWYNRALFLRDERDLIFKDNAGNNIEPSYTLAYFSGIELIVIDSAETWVINFSQEKLKIIQALLRLEKTPILFTITDDALAGFVKVYFSSGIKYKLILAKPFDWQDINEILQEHISGSAISSFQSAGVAMSICRIPFWLNYFLSYKEELGKQILTDMDQEEIKELIVKAVIKGKNKKIASERKLIWRSICLNSHFNRNIPIDISSFSAAATASLEEENILIKHGDGRYGLQHDLFYDVYMRLHFDKKLKSARIKNDFSSLFDFIDNYVKFSSIHLSIIKHIELLYKHIKLVSPAVARIFICAALIAEECDALRFLLKNFEPMKAGEELYFNNSYYHDFYLVALRVDNWQAIEILAREKIPLFVPKSYAQLSSYSSADESESESVSSEGDGYDLASRGSGDDSRSARSFYSESSNDPFIKWYENPHKYCFSEFEPEPYFGFESHDFDEENGIKIYEQRPDYNNHFRYLISARKNESYSTFRNLVQMHLPIIYETNNYKETFLHYAVSVDDLKMVKLLIATRACIDALDNLDETPLHNACYAKNWDVAHELLKVGVDPNQYNCYGVTPFHIALAARDREMIKLLFDYGADVTMYCQHEDCPLIQFICDVEDANNVDDDNYILFLMLVFSYDNHSAINLNGISGLTFKEQNKIIKVYEKLPHDQFNQWLCREYSSQSILVKSLVTKFNNITFARSLKTLLNDTDYNFDQFKASLERGKYFKAVSYLGKINKYHITLIFERLKKDEAGAKGTVTRFLLEQYSAWIPLVEYAFRNDEEVKQVILEDWPLSITIPKFLECAIKAEDGEMFDEVVKTINWNDEIVQVLQEYFSSSNDRINGLLDANRKASTNLRLAR